MTSGFQAGAWVWLQDPGVVCQVVEGQALWGASSYRVWLPAQDAVIRVDGRAAGSTWGNGSVRFELAPGRHRVEVVREGWTPFTQEFSLEAGEFRPVPANLTAAAQ